MKSALTLDETRQMFLYVAKNIIAIQDLLGEADRAIGDGDHGVGMARGFEAVEAKLNSGSFNGLDELFKVIGISLLTTMGGASGAIFGTWFRGGSKNLAAQMIFDSEHLAWFLNDGLQAVQERGKAKVGDKTMVDVLAPAAAVAIEMANQPLETSLNQILVAAEKGMESTKQMVATLGRAKSLGERSLGHPDPGAVSTCYILKFMRDAVIQAELIPPDRA